MANAARDMKMMAHIKTMQAKHLIDEKSELQSQLQDREQRIRLLTAETKGEVLHLFYFVSASWLVDDLCPAKFVPITSFGGGEVAIRVLGLDSLDS